MANSRSTGSAQFNCPAICFKKGVTTGKKHLPLLTALCNSYIKHYSNINQHATVTVSTELKTPAHCRRLLLTSPAPPVQMLSCRPEHPPSSIAPTLPEALSSGCPQPGWFCPLSWPGQTFTRPSTRTRRTAEERDCTFQCQNPFEGQ